MPCPSGPRAPLHTDAPCRRRASRWPCLSRRRSVSCSRLVSSHPHVSRSLSLSVCCTRLCASRARAHAPCACCRNVAPRHAPRHALSSPTPAPSGSILRWAESASVGASALDTRGRMCSNGVNQLWPLFFRPLDTLTTRHGSRHSTRREVTTAFASLTTPLRLLSQTSRSLQYGLVDVYDPGEPYSQSDRQCDADGCGKKRDAVHHSSGSSSRTSASTCSTVITVVPSRSADLGHASPSDVRPVWRTSCTRAVDRPDATLRHGT